MAQANLLKEPKKLLEKLISYDKDHMADSLIAKVRPFLDDPLMDPDKIAAASKALKPVRVWIGAMIKYHDTLKIVNPLREVARLKGEELAVVEAELAKKQAQVKEINDKLAALNADKAALEAKEKALNDEIIDCGLKLGRAEKMITGLEGEKVRWTETVASLG